MKKFFICATVLLFFVVGVFANENTTDSVRLTFKMPKTGLNLNNPEKYKKQRTPWQDQALKRAGAITATVFGSILFLGGGALAGITIWEETMASGFLYSWGGIPFFQPIFSHCLLFCAAVLLYLGIYKLAVLSKGSYTNWGWAADLITVKRDLAIMTLATSAVPLSGLISTVALMVYQYEDSKGTYMQNYYHEPFILPLVFCSLIVIVHLAVGGGLLGNWCYKMNKMGSWAMRHLMPDIALTHDDKKGFNEGYGVSLGMRVRI